MPDIFFTEAKLIYIINKFFKEIKQQRTTIAVIQFYNRLMYKLVPTTRVIPVD
jgi:hypothetical protein